MGERVSFSPCGNYLAHFPANGNLRIWETETSVLKQEFIPVSHLSSHCSSTAWVPVISSPGKMKKKKRRLSIDHQMLLLVLGTDGGQVAFFSLAESDIIASSKCHNRPVASITALPGTDLYTGAGNVVFRWSISDRRIKSEWKCEGHISSMLISDDNTVLVTALFSNIVCWNVDSQTVLKKFVGHKSKVVSMCMNVAPSGERYLFTAAAEDRLVNVWNLDSTNNKSVAMFILPDVPCGISSDINSNGLITFAAVSKSGSLHVYSHQLNGQCGKPLKPKTTVLVTSDKPKTAKKTELIPIIAGSIFGQKLKIAFGSSPFICCESIDLSSSDSELFLVRKDPRRSTKTKEESVQKVKNAETSGNVEYLSPATVSNVSSKRDRDAIDAEERETMATLLDKMNISSSKEPSGDTLAHLLVQGLNSQDREILRRVLFTQNERKIKSTVERLPAQAVLPLLKILNNLIQGKTFVSQIGAMWLQAILRTHVSQLLADENCASVVVPLLGMVERRLTCLGPLCQLKGRLDLLLDQTSSLNRTEPVVDIPPLLVYQDNDSPANSNCLLKDSDDSDDNDVSDDEDGDKWTDLIDENDLEDNDDAEIDEDEGSEEEGSSNKGDDDDDDNNNSDEDMDTSS